MATIPAFSAVNRIIPDPIRRQPTARPDARDVGDSARFTAILDRSLLTEAPSTATFAEATETADRNPTFAEEISNAEPTFAEQVEQAPETRPFFAALLAENNRTFAEIATSRPPTFAERIDELGNGNPRTPAEVAAANRSEIGIREELNARGRFEAPGRLQVEGGSRLARDASRFEELPAQENPQPPATTAVGRAFIPTVLPGQTFDLLI